MLTNILDVLRGIVLNPVLTAAARGVAEGAVFLALYAVIDLVAAGQLPDSIGQFAPFILFGVRSLEGVADKIDPAKQRQRAAADAALPDSVARDTVSEPAGPAG